MTTSLLDATRAAMAQMSQLLGMAAESVSGLTPAEGGLRLHVEVVELDRIPPSTSIMATYDVAADGAGNVLSFQRIRRYLRSEAGQ